MDAFSSSPSDLSVLDPRISLPQELNVCSPALSARAESGRLSARAPSQEGLEPEEALALAVVMQAVEDWQDAVARLKRVPDDREAAGLKTDAERFFRSRWFHLLMDLDGAALLSQLRAQSEAPESAPPSPLHDLRLLQSRQRMNRAHRNARKRLARRA